MDVCIFFFHKLIDIIAMVWGGSNIPVQGQEYHLADTSAVCHCRVQE
jgi:hypothetical protein